jgi:coniferyl-aldehyde dehydrogenase
MEAASANLTPVTLELGGKSPTIVDDAVPLEGIVDRIVFAKSLNAGQTCVAPDHVYVPEQRVEAFVAAYRRAFTAMYPRLGDNPHYTAIASDRQHARLRSLLADARAQGAAVTEINPAAEDLGASRKMAPHLLLGTTPAMRVMQQEIFGPLLPVIAYRSIDEVIRRINAGPRPLALYLFSDDRGLQQRVLRETRSGGVGFNEALLQAAVDDLPFGGIGASGMGEYHGEEGFRTFSKPRGVIRKGRLNSARLVYPPYGGWIQRLAFRLGLR